jgi:uncharacterized membrane protein
MMIGMLASALLVACSSRLSQDASNTGGAANQAKGASGKGKDGGSSDPFGNTTVAGGGGSGSSSAGAGATSNGGAARGGSTHGASDAGANAGPEVCDGIDNDGNGIVDDVDAEHDGVCDCLSIATIGEIGPWSNGGNVFKTWLSSRSPQGAVELADQVLSDDLLKRYQVIVVLYASTSELSAQGRTLAAHHMFSDDEVAAFERWVRKGGGVMTTIGYTSNEASEVVNVNRLLAPLGMGYSTTKLDLGGYIQNWTAHPLTDGVSNIFTDNGVEPGGSAGMTLARDQGMRVALQAAQTDQGRVVVWGDEWITYDSQWQAINDQQVARFWLNILKWLSPPTVCQVAIPVL